MIEQHIQITPTYKEVARTAPVISAVFTDEIIPKRFDVAKEYKVVLSLTTTFLAEDDSHSYNLGVKHATRCLKAELYHDITRILIYARKSTYEQDWRQTMLHLDEIAKICGQGVGDV